MVATTDGGGDVDVLDVAAGGGGVDVVVFALADLGARTSPTLVQNPSSSVNAE